MSGGKLTLSVKIEPGLFVVAMLVTGLLLVIKLMAVPAMSWWWVFSPLLVLAGIGVFMVVVFIVVMVGAARSR